MYKNLTTEQLEDLIKQLRGIIISNTICGMDDMIPKIAKALDEVVSELKGRKNKNGK